MEAKPEKEDDDHARARDPFRFKPWPQRRPCSDFCMTYARDGGPGGNEVDIILEFEAIRQPG